MKIIETQPVELVRLASNFFRKTHHSMPVVERVWDGRIGDYVLHARRIFATAGRAPGSVAAVVSAPLCRAAEEGRVYLDSGIYQLATDIQPVMRPRKVAKPRVIVFSAPRRRPFALATRVRLSA